MSDSTLNPVPPYTVLAADRPPFVYVDLNRIGNARFYGLLVDLLPTLFIYAGLNATFVYELAAVNAGGDLINGTYANGTWSGIVGQLVAGDADIAAFPLTLTIGRPEAIDLTYGYDNGGIGLLVNNYVQTGSGTLAFLKPFAWQLWLAIGAAILFVTVGLYVLSRISPFGQFEVKKIRRTDIERSQMQEYVVASANDSALMETCITQLGQMPLPRSRSWAVRIFTLCYGFFAVIILASYTANLAAYLTVQHLTTSINSLTDLLQTNQSFAVAAGGSTYDYFENALDPLAAKLAASMVVFADNDAAVAAVRNHSMEAFLTDYPTLQSYADELPCDLSVVGTPFGPGILTFGLPKNSSLTPSLDNALLTLSADGVLDQLIRKWTSDISQCGDGTSANANNLELYQVAGLFYMLLIFGGLALLLAFGERYLDAFLTRHPVVLQKAHHFFHKFRPKQNRYDFGRSFNARRLSLTQRFKLSRRQNSAGSSTVDDAVNGKQERTPPHGFTADRSGTMRSSSLPSIANEHSSERIEAAIAAGFSDPVV